MRRGTTEVLAVGRSWSKYFHRRALWRPLCGRFDSAAPIGRAVIIPSLAESAFLPCTLASLERSSLAERATALVVVVVNNGPPDAVDPALLTDNRRTLAWLAAYAPTANLPLVWIDAATSGHELPAGAGVGMARRLGCDSLLARLVRDGARDAATLKDLVLFHLDADTLVAPSYFRAAAGLRAAGCAGATLPFRHQTAATAPIRTAVGRYELYLHYYVSGLRWAGSPYAFHTVGSAMLCTASGYVRAGGMPSGRRAGEDFYFLQQLAKTGKVVRLRGTTVYPSARLSTRVPFGTGPSVTASLDLADPDFAVPAIAEFSELRNLLTHVRSHWDRSTAAVLDGPFRATARAFLLNRGLDRVWPRFQAQHKTREQRLAAFHCWFDALATRRFLNHLGRQSRPRQGLLQAWAEMLPLVAPGAEPELGRDENALLAFCRRAFHAEPPPGPP